MLVAPINPSDKNQIEGVYPIKKASTQLEIKNYITQEAEKTEAYVGGNEGIGQVLAIGSSAPPALNGPISVGDYVMPMSTGSVGTWANAVHAHPSSLVVFRNRSNVTVEQLGSLKVNASTSYRMLRDIVQLNPGDYVIQNGANSGVGQVLIQLARNWGFKTINVIRDRPDFEQVKKELESLGADLVLSESELSNKETVQKVKQHIGTSQIKLGVNCVCGKSAVQMARYLSENGYFVTYGAMAKQPMAIPAALFIFKNITFKGYWVSKWYKETDPKSWFSMWDELCDMFSSNKLVEQKMHPIHVPSFNLPSDSPMVLTSEEQASFDHSVTEALSSGAKKSYFKFI
ncbi:putative trans-2-enoyl-CoA reductase, mitochondrial [Smittium mucronatum]|uniref:Putative trans-2-enoyl-CoA reductase, mitochondrial n=1 Tax=Smittium mucronatum TaxID=133383 RepID=A0A1R0H2W9_9FUNG|nr:putative trans-2-enoyl-CoA reductase, mitochondrial [Smittium mucronatum]